MGRKLLIACMLLLALSFGCVAGGSTSEITSLVGISLAFMVLVIALAYMAAALFKRPEYETFASIEIHQLLISALLFITILSAAYFSAQLADAFAGRDQYEIGREYLTYMTNEIALKTIIKLQGTLLFSQFMGSWSMRWGAGAWGVAVPSFPSFILIERVVDFLLLLISPFASSLVVQQAILEVLKGTMLPFVLPAAVVLRIFPPTRDASSFLIAASIGFGIIFPFTYVMHSAIVRPLIAQAFQSSALPDWETQLKSNRQNFVSDVEESGFFSYSSLIVYPLTSLSFLLLQALFLPALSISLTVAFIKGFSKFISQKLV